MQQGRPGTEVTLGILVDKLGKELLTRELVILTECFLAIILHYSAMLTILGEQE